jgi:hypothetical protein
MLMENHCYACVAAVKTTTYAHGPNNSLVYRGASGHVHVEPDAFNLTSEADLSTVLPERVTTTELDLDLYPLPAVRRDSVRAVLYSWGILLIALGYPLSVAADIVRFYQGSPAFQNLLRIQPADFLGDPDIDIYRFLVGWKVITRNANPVPFFFGVGTLVGLIVTLLPKRRPFSYFPALRMLRGAFSPHARIGHTQLGRRLETTVALSPSWTEADLRALVRRISGEMRFREYVHPSEIDSWVSDNITQIGSAPIPAIPLGCCVTCLRPARLRHCICASCRAAMQNPYLWALPCCFLTEHVGMRPLFTTRPIFEITNTKWRSSDVVPRFNGVVFDDLNHMMAFLMPLVPDSGTCRGRLCGPMFLGHIPACYERGDVMVALAAGVRLLVTPPKHEYADGEDPPSFLRPFMELSTLAQLLYPELIQPLMPWTPEMVLDHQRVPAKRRQLEQCYAEIAAGIVYTVAYLMKVTPFIKAEKHTTDGFSSYGLTPKKKQVPRCINPVHPHVNAMCAPLTLPMSKLLNRLFNANAHIFYASGAKPSEINDFLNNASSTCRYVLEDDVSFADGGHSEGSFFFQDVFKTAQFPGKSPYLQDLFDSLSQGKMRCGRFSALVRFVNLSGVPLTSWTNTIVFIFVRLVALAYAFHLVTLDDFSSHVEAMIELISSFFMAVAGDDGLTFLPQSYNGVRSGTTDFLSRYSAAWAYFGFYVPASKIRFFPPSRWRLSTFLAMRPVWSGTRYEYGVEIARRLRHMFWQIDNNMHPVAWARGISTSLLTASRHVPVVRDVCDWYLHNTSGAITNMSFTNPYSTFYGYEIQGDLNPRAVSEFLEDYGITADEYADFRGLLLRTSDVLVNLNHVVLEKIFSLE